jgi:hypothetical protein
MTTITDTQLQREAERLSELVQDGPVAVVHAGTTVAYVISPADFERSKSRARIPGFAADLIGDFDATEFCSVTAEEMGFEVPRHWARGDEAAALR